MVLHNQTRLCYVRSDALAAPSSLFGWGFGAALIKLTACFTTMREGANDEPPYHGMWAGDRFEILSLAESNATIQGSGREWRDSTNEVRALMLQAPWFDASASW